MKIDKLYRLYYESSDKHIEGDFFTSREEALEDLDNMKDMIAKIYEDDDGYPFDSIICLNEINLNEIEDIDFYADNKIISTWIPDLDSMEDDGTIYYMWSDEEK